MALANSLIIDSINQSIIDSLQRKLYWILGTKSTMQETFNPHVSPKTVNRTNSRLKKDSFNTWIWMKLKQADNLRLRKFRKLTSFECSQNMEIYVNYILSIVSIVSVWTVPVGFICCLNHIGVSSAKSMKIFLYNYDFRCSTISRWHWLTVLYFSD